ncbi:C-type lectin domain family 2 member B [Anolis carolinensis]|uniref:C-type lectin domain family 2 member B n=1 Tax=Anolis carolinensis TaxID=28377 RepID=UPI0004624D26|nr:PREDICTED: C-type lectin domain family 2 member B [Anolis carolinensis]|eukprot:XP_008122873.1 PREDICTED: C-type lectin domain family 2 member B [Anolis carolinensis]
MAACKNPLETETKNGNSLNTSEQIALDFSGKTKASEREQLTQTSIPLPADRSPSTHILARGPKTKWKKKKNCILMTVLPIASSVVTALIVLGVMPTKSSCGICPATTVLSCPSGWVGYEGKCYNFSESEGTWDSSQNNCSASGASLVVIEDQKEMDFIMQHKRATDYWIGLKREKGQPWKWPNGTVFNGWFEIGADGPCAYLNDEKASSTLCVTRRNWICSMPAHGV